MINRLDPETRGALAYVCATFVFVCMDAIAKHLGDFLPPLQVVWARYTGQTLLLVVVFLPSLHRRLRSKAPRLQLTRSVLLFAATALFFTAVAVLPLAEATAVMEIAPLLVTVLAAFVLNERVGPRRWVGVAVGLIGALIVIRPGLEVFQPISLLLVVAAFCLAAYQIATRAMGGIDSIWTTMLYTTLFGTLASSAAMPWVWSPPPPEALLPLALIGVLGCAGHLCLVWALSQAQASVLAPFAYTQLVWATALGFLIFAEVPDGATILGGAVIVGAGLYVWHRERLARRRAEQAGVAASA